MSGSMEYFSPLEMILCHSLVISKPQGGVAKGIYDYAIGSLFVDSSFSLRSFLYEAILIDVLFSMSRAQPCLPNGEGILYHTFFQ